MKEIHVEAMAFLRGGMWSAGMENGKASKGDCKVKEAAPRAAKIPMRHRAVEARPPESISRRVRELHNAAIHLAWTAIECFGWGKEAKRSALNAAEDMPEDGVAALTAFTRP